MSAPITVPVAKFDKQHLSHTTELKRAGVGRNFDVLYKGRHFVLQLGLKDDPLSTYGGAEFFDKKGNKFESVTNEEDTSWVFGGDTQFNNLLTSKIGGSLTLNKSREEGTQAYHVRRVLNEIKAYTAAALASNPEFKSSDNAEMVAMMLRSSLDESEEYADKMRFKVRYHVRDEGGRTVKNKDQAGAVIQYTAEQKAKMRLTFDMAVINVTDKGGLEAFNSLAKNHDDSDNAVGDLPRSRGVYLVKMNPVFIQNASSIFITYDLMRAVVERTKNAVDSVAFDFGGEEEPAAESAAPEFEFGGGSQAEEQPSTGKRPREEEETEEPAAKRACPPPAEVSVAAT